MGVHHFTGPGQTCGDLCTITHTELVAANEILPLIPMKAGSGMQ